ncbi:hypothetical protein L484_020897 [Morus notabilis]|uniref:Uncharacterized protein n=1 Tax=Morus notabilis TaxID=981085 RepID=W9QRQ7_9ROSA|nr:hypothetical protein L484_020897 [Morus notabilis]
MDFVEALKSDQGGVQQEGGSGGGGNCKLLGWIGKLTWYQSGRVIKVVYNRKVAVVVVETVKVIDGYALSLNDAMGIHYQIQKKQHFAGSSHLPFRNNWPAQKEIVIPVFIKEECHWLAAVVDIMKKNVNDLVA